MAGSLRQFGFTWRFLRQQGPLPSHLISKQEAKMNYKTVCISLLLASTAACLTASAQPLDGKLPIYPNAHNLSDMPPSAISAGVPMVVDTSDSVETVDGWYSSNTKSCTRTAQSGGIKFQCPGGSIMIYAHGAKTQVAFVPSLF
jgi:hypothetical protein